MILLDGVKYFMASYSENYTYYKLYILYNIFYKIIYAHTYIYILIQLSFIPFYHCCLEFCFNHVCLKLSRNNISASLWNPEEIPEHQYKSYAFFFLDLGLVKQEQPARLFCWV